MSNSSSYDMGYDMIVAFFPVPTGHSCSVGQADMCLDGLFCFVQPDWKEPGFPVVWTVSF